jgi:hypothetical protein
VESVIGSLRRRLARRSLKPQLNQTRTWVRQGRTDAWIAHQLEVSVGDIRSFKREHELVPDEGANGDESVAPTASDEELDLRAEDDARVAAALEAEEDVDEEDSDEAGAAADDDERPKRRRRGRRGGRGRRRKARDLEGTFDHGEEGYGLWLDPAIQDDPVYAEHWAGHRPVTVSVEPDRLVISRAGEETDGDDEDD